MHDMENGAAEKRFSEHEDFHFAFAYNELSCEKSEEHAMN